VKVFKVNVASTFLLPSTVREHVPVPEHEPDHPSNTDPSKGFAVNIIIVPISNASEQSVPQFIPAGFDVIMPLPLPFFVNERI
jgi:hypothetical protein